MKKMMMLVVGLLLMNAVSAQDQGMTGETHRKNVGKILWAKERILMNRQDQVQYETTFNISDPLYGRVFLEKSLPRISEAQGKNCYNNNSNFRMKVYVDGVDKGEINRNYFPGGSTWTSCQINLNLSAGDGVDNVNIGVPQKWSELIKTLNDGKHEFRFEFYGGSEDQCLKKVAEGSFTLNKSGEQAAAKIKTLPAALKKDAALESSMVQAIQSRGWKNESPLKVIIVEGDWRMIRDVFGNIIRREINTNVILKKNDGSCRLTDISFTQEHKGNNRFGITEVYGIGTKNIPFDCDAVK